MQHVTAGFPAVSPIYLEQTTYFDFNHERVKDFSNRAIEGTYTNKQKAELIKRYIDASNKFLLKNKNN